MGELDLIDYIRKRFQPCGKGLVKGIGDDAAVIAPSGEQIVVTSDMMCEGVHFVLSYITPFQLGWKLISVNVSDVYAMRARPAFALLDLAFPSKTPKKFASEFLDGVAEACKLYDLSLIGGDLSSSKSGISISATLLGYAVQPVLRSGARPGDSIYLTGSTGDSAMGLELLKKIKRPVDFKRPVNKPLSWDIMKPLLKRHLMPLARDSRQYKHATSMLDISDGLLLDLFRLCTESRTGARIYESALLMSPELVIACEYLGKDPFKTAVSGGEDYELLFTAPKGVRIKAQVIGEITRTGLELIDNKGGSRPIKPEGYRHFED